MSGKTKIEWTDRTWNPVTGCSKVSEGCRNCYAERHARRFWGERKFTDVQCHPDRLDQPLHWRKPSRIFVNSMSDLFHKDVPDEFISKVIWTIKRCPQHTFQILTKRPERMRIYMNILNDQNKNRGDKYWPINNLWLGVSAEDQKTADERIPLLLQTPAAVRFVSYEPALGPIDLEKVPLPDAYLTMNGITGCLQPLSEKDTEPDDYRYWTRKSMKLDWVICGGESGAKARPMHPNWARSIRDQCVDAGVPYFFKQHGEWATEFPQGISLKNVEQRFIDGTSYYRIGKKAAGRLLDGREWNEYPEVRDERV